MPHKVRLLNLVLLFTLLFAGVRAQPPVTAAQVAYDCTTATGLPQSDCEALVALYNATDGDNWTDNTDWLMTTTPCDWYGVTCSAGRVMELILAGNRLNGPIPPEIGNLTALWWLDLGDIWIDGLHLTNNLSGSIPSEIGDLTALSHLLLSYNQLSGPIPPEIGNLTALGDLDLSNNQLSGHIPSEISNLTALFSITLDNNQLSGPIPSWIGNFLSLWNLNLGSNQLSEPIPPEIGNLSNLIILALSDNQLSGPLPDALTILMDISYLGFYDTQVCVPATGSVPAWLMGIQTVDGSGLVCGQTPGCISGVVTLPDASQAVGIQVTLYQWVGWNVHHTTSTQTTTAGTYQFDGLGQDIDYVVRFSDLSHTYLPEYYNDVLALDQATPVTVALNSSTCESADAVLSAGYFIFLPLMLRGQ